MNWEAIGAIGEVLGAILVLLTLAFLAVQIRQNTASVKASTYQNLLSERADWQRSIVSSENAGLMIKGLYRQNSLSSDEASQYHVYMLQLLQWARSAVLRPARKPLPPARRRWRLVS